MLARMNHPAPPDCVLCAPSDAATLTVWRHPLLRVVRVLDAPDFPAFYRVIWQAHVPEFDDLCDADRVRVMDAVTVVSRVLRRELAPTKLNLAALGNVVPHLHWHVVARFAWDSHFPQPIWGAAQRAGSAQELARVSAALPAVDSAVVVELNAVIGATQGRDEQPAAASRKMPP